MKPYLFATAALFCATTAAADLIVTFDEGAPKDRFTFQNTGTGSLPAATLRIDLKNSAGGLVFDVDDTLGQREITVNDAEISGAEGSITAQNLRSSASFSGDTAVISVTCS
jgi:polyisoprenoid-binding protein YceI